MAEIAACLLPWLYNKRQRLKRTACKSDNPWQIEALGGSKKHNQPCLKGLLLWYICEMFTGLLDLTGMKMRYSCCKDQLNGKYGML